MYPVDGKQEESGVVVDMHEACATLEPLVGLLCTLTPQAHSLGLAETCREPFWRLLADFCHQKEMLLKIQQITTQWPILQAGGKNFQALYCCDGGTFTCCLSPSFQVGVWTRLQMPWNLRVGSDTLKDNPAQGRAGFTGQVIDEPRERNWWLFLGETPWVIKWYFYFILNSKLIITCAVTHVILPNLKNEGNEVEKLFSNAKEETHRYGTETMRKASVLSSVLWTEHSKHLYSFMLTSCVNPQILITLQPLSRNKCLSCKSGDILWLHQNLLLWACIMFSDILWTCAN